MQILWIGTRDVAKNKLQVKDQWVPFCESSCSAWPYFLSHGTTGCSKRHYATEVRI